MIRERRTGTPMLPLEFFRSRNFSAADRSTVAFYGVFKATSSCSPSTSRPRSATAYWPQSTRTCLCRPGQVPPLRDTSRNGVTRVAPITLTQRGMKCRRVESGVRVADTQDAGEEYSNRYSNALRTGVNRAERRGTLHAAGLRKRHLPER